MDTNQTIATKSSKQYWTGSLYYMVTFLIAGSWFPYLNVYLTKLGLSGQQVGMLSILSPISAMLISTAIAAQADRTQRRRLFAQIGMVATAVCIFLLRYPTSYGGILALMLFYAIFSSPLMTLSDALISRMAQRHKLNFGGMRLWGSFMFAVASVAFGGLWEIYGFKPMFVVASVLYIPLIWVTGKLEEGPASLSKENIPLSRVLKDIGLVYLLVATFLAGISNSIFMAFGGIYASWMGAGELLIGVMIAAGGMAELPAMFYSNLTANRLGKVNTAILSYGLMALAYLGYIIAPNPSYLPLFSILKGLGYGLWLTVTIRILVERTPPEWAATAQSFLTLTWFGLSPIVAGPLGGWLYDTIHPAAIYVLNAVTLFAGAVVLWLAARAKKLD